METATIEQIKENFPTSFTDDERAKIYEDLSASVSRDEAMEMFDIIIENVEKAVNNGKVPDYDKWTRLDKILWAVKEAYVAGKLDGMELMTQYNRISIETLFPGRKYKMTKEAI